MTVVNSKTICVVIQKPLVVASCPIRTCAWRAANGFCKYSRDAERLDPQSLALLLGRTVPTADEVTSMKADLLMAVKKTLQA